MMVGAERTLTLGTEPFSGEAPVPITAKLSRQFYEKFGDSVVNELVDLLNNVDFNSRSELRDVNELNFARFDAKVEQRFAESDARVDVRFAQSDAKWEKRFTEFGAKLDKRFADYDVKWEKRFTESDVKMEKRFADADVKMEQRFARFETRMLRWMFTLWTGTTITLAGLVLVALRAR
jgi:hypothetical protein